MNKREIGTSWEKTAVEYLAARGMRILECNFRCRQGEVDIIGLHQGVLVFVEVKYRKGTNMGEALEAVTPVKMRKICQVAMYYRHIKRFSQDLPIRYDVVAIQNGKIQWIKNAFLHQYE